MNHDINWMSIPNLCEGDIAALNKRSAVVCSVSDRSAIQSAAQSDMAQSPYIKKYMEQYFPSSDRTLLLENDFLLMEDDPDQFGDPSEYWPGQTFDEVLSAPSVNSKTSRAFPSELFFELIKWAQALNHLPSMDVVLHEILTSRWVVPVHSDHHQLDAVRDHIIFSSVIGNQNAQQESVLSIITVKGIQHVQLGLGDMYLLDPAVPHSLHPHLPGQEYGGYLPETDPLGQQMYHQVFIPRSWVLNTTYARILEILITTAFKASGHKI